MIPTGPSPVTSPSLGMTPLDLATGGVWGREPRAPLSRDPATPTVREAITELARSIDRRDRAFLAFSGGTDSSIALAIATQVAREQDAPDPVPITIRYPDIDASIDPWQERVVAHLGLQDWVRINARDELDVVGPHAQATLRRHGILFPANGYVVEPQAEVAAGGALIVPIGGSDFHLFWHWGPLMDVVAGRRRPARRDLPHAVLAAMPRRARRRLLRRRLEREAPAWLTPEGKAELVDVMAATAADTPLSFAAAIREQRTHRCFAVTQQGLDDLAAHHDVALVLPTLDDRITAATAHQGGWRGPGDRLHAVQAQFGDLLPWQERRRYRKPSVHGAFFGRHTREFVAQWSGGGLEGLPVNLDVLRSQWAAGTFHFRSMAMLQLAWLHDHPTHSL